MKMERFGLAIKIKQNFKKRISINKFKSYTDYKIRHIIVLQNFLNFKVIYRHSS